MVFLLFAMLLIGSQGNPPIPSSTVKGKPPQQPTAESQKNANANERGSEESPVIVKVLPPTETKQEAADRKAKEEEQSSANWWMVRLTGLLFVVGLGQTFVFWKQAQRLKETIEKMEAISSQQTADVKASINEASRSASAMEAVAYSMQQSSTAAKASVEITREIADRQKLITELQSRPYIVVTFEAMVPQLQSGLRFEPKMRIANLGNTPAYDIRVVIRADAQPYPLPDEFSFSLPEPIKRSSYIGPGLHKIGSGVVPKRYSDAEVQQLAAGVGQRIFCWGLVRYRDIFEIERYVRFGYNFYQVSGDNWFSEDTFRHNEAD